ncbi:MAG: hypothetical protein WCH58_01545 [Candidatus Saccharibacteria bacterium]
MSTDEFTRLFNYMTERFDKIDKILETKADSDDLQRALGLLDALAKRQEISDDERLVMGHQLTRLHDWVEEAAKRIDLKFVH